MAGLGGVRRFQLDFNNGESTVYAQILPMRGSYHLYVTSAPDGAKMENLVCAMQTPYDTMPASTHLVDSENFQTDQWAISLSQKLSKALQTQMLVSCSLPQGFESHYPYLELELLKLLTEMSLNSS